MNSSWSSNSEPIYSYSFSSADFLAIQLRPRFSRHRSTIFNEPESSHFLHTNWCCIFSDYLLPFLILLLKDKLHPIVRDCNHDWTLPLTLSNLFDLLVSPTRGNYTLHRIITNHLELHCPKLRPVISTNDNFLLHLYSKVYHRTALQSFKES